jgi:ribonuclease HI
MHNWEDTPEIDLYSDGGADPNPGKAGFGVILSYKGKKKEFSKGYKFSTNNRMELSGVIFGLECLKTKSIVNVYTDSKYVINGIELGWAEKWRANNWYRTKSQKAINHDLWAKLLTLIDQQEKVTFHWVKGHAGHLENERCDELATLGMTSADLLEDKGYEPNQESVSLVHTTIKSPSNRKVKKEGDPCRKCETAVIVTKPKKRKIKENQSYYFEWYLQCPNCRNIYHVEEAKRTINKSDQLF